MSRRRPVRRWRILAGAAVALVALTGIVGLAETLRHPLPSGGPVVAERPGDPAADPRTEVACPEPTPGGDGGRDGPALTPRPEPVAVTSTELYDCPQAWDGRLVAYEGEVVGGVLERADGAWAQVNDDVYAGAAGPLPAHREYRGANSGVGVLVPPALAAEIAAVGGPRQRGDRLAVEGRFHRVDAASGEVAVIRAERGEVVATGQPLVEVRLPDRERVAALLGALALALVAAERWQAWRRRRAR
ncbi:MAG: hypothetical protein ACQETV_08875 [Actinomycetota bacterium]